MNRPVRAVSGLALAWASLVVLSGALGSPAGGALPGAVALSPAHTDTPIWPQPSPTPSAAPDTATPAEPSATPSAAPTDTVEPSATPLPTDTATPSPTDTATPSSSPVPTPEGTALPPVEPGLLLEPDSQYAGGVVTARGANYACGRAGVELAWAGQVRLGVARADPFSLVLTLPASVAAGVYDVVARCAGTAGVAARATLRLRVPPPPPAAAFLAPEGAVTVGQVLRFSEAASAGVVRRDWDFGDGSPARHEPSPGHVFALPGSYTVTLAVWDGAGRTALASRPVEVADATAQGRSSVQPDGRTVAFVDQSRGPFTWTRWEFGDGATSSRRTANHTYDRPGTYMPRLVTGFPGPGGAMLVRSAELGPLVIGPASNNNLALAGLQVVQVNLADRVLSAGRQTVARVFVRREGSADMAGARYDVRLLAYRADGTRLSGSPVLRRRLTMAATPPLRQDVVDLELPREWTLPRPRALVDPDLGAVDVAEPITLAVQVRALNLREDNGADNELARPVTFDATGGLDLLLLAAPEPGRRIDMAGLWSELRRALPVPGTHLRLWLPLGGDTIEPRAAVGAGPAAALAASAQAWRTANALQPALRAVALAPATDGDSPEPCAVALAAGGAGLWVAATAEGASRGPAAMATSLVHGLGHLLGLAPFPGGPAPGTGLDPAYPRPDGSLDGDGFDVADLSVRERASHFDYLSHAACAGGRPWWSAYGHGRVTHRLGAQTGAPLPLGTLFVPPLVGSAQAQGPAGAPPPRASDYAALAGVVQPPGSRGERVAMAPVFHDWERRAPADDHPGSGAWSLTLADEAGRALVTRRFDLSFPADAAGRRLPRAFFQVLPWHAFTRRVVLSEAGEERWAAELPLEAPGVTLLAPAGGAEWAQGQAYTVRWLARDPGGRPLTHRVDLSADEGLTWRPLGGDLVDSQLTVHTAFLPGCATCRLRVRATNGLLMGEAVSAPFAIAAPAPVVAILSPADGATVAANEPLWLQGVAYDPTDGPLGAARVAWLSNRDGGLGLDPTLQTQLSVGSHTLRFSAINSAGRASQAQISLRVIPARRDHSVWLPHVGVE